MTYNSMASLSFFMFMFDSIVVNKLRVHVIVDCVAAFKFSEHWLMEVREYT